MQTRLRPYARRSIQTGLMLAPDFGASWKNLIFSNILSWRESNLDVKSCGARGNMSTGASGRPARRWRNPLSVRLRTLMLLVGAVAAGLGWWQYRLRRAAVDGLLAVVPSGILLEPLRPSTPARDPTYAPDRGRYAIELSQVRAQHGEVLAETELAEALRKARLRGDEKSMRGALSALMSIGRGSPEAVAQITRTALGSDFPPAKSQGAYQIRCLAVHVLGQVARQDDAALRSLIETVEGPDESFQQVITASAANELGGLDERARAAVPALIKGLSPRQYRMPYGLLCISSINALDRIGPEARAAAPELIAIAEDHRADEYIRSCAIRALVSITTDLRRIDVKPTESHASIVTTFARLLSDDSPSLRKEAGRALSGVRGTLHLSARTESLLEWMLRIEEMVLGPGHPEMATTVGQLKRLYLVRGKKEEAAKLETRTQGNQSPSFQ